MNPWLYIWQATIALGVYVVIRMNGAGWIHGWLFGFLIQLLQAGYGLITHSWGYLLALLPGAAFLQVWVSKLRERKQRERRLCPPRSG